MNFMTSSLSSQLLALINLHGDETEHAEHKNQNAKYCLFTILHATAREHQDAWHCRHHDADKLQLLERLSIGLWIVHLRLAFSSLEVIFAGFCERDDGRS